MEEKTGDPTVYGKCMACGSTETGLHRVSGFINLSDIGESSLYPVGYGCELCS